MARVKISEYRAKIIINRLLGLDYDGLSFDTSKSNDEAVARYIKDKEYNFVVKVDQAVKTRNKQGLVVLDIPAKNVMDNISLLKKRGYRWLLVEPFLGHNLKAERFLALERGSDGITIMQSLEGGVDIELHKDSVVTLTSGYPHNNRALDDAFENVGFIKDLLKIFDDLHFTYLEINPYIVCRNNRIAVLDAAVEVDSSAEFFVNKVWSASDIRTPNVDLSEEERVVKEIDSKTPSSLTLQLLNKDGSIFLLLSGGGASVVVADEFSFLGLHDQIANYGEYSGNPSEEEVYLYSTQVLKLLLESHSQKKVLLVAGAVANFTDISKTFNGIIRAIDECLDLLLLQDVSIFVRRGGPNQEDGLNKIKKYLAKSGLFYQVHSPEVSLSSVVLSASERLKK